MLVQQIKNLLSIFLLFTIILNISICSYCIITNTINIIGLWYIAHIILSIYILIRNSELLEEEILILTIMSFINLYSTQIDTDKTYFFTIIMSFLSINIIFIGIIKILKNNFPLISIFIDYLLLCCKKNNYQELNS